jgi:hypothetical protein
VFLARGGNATHRFVLGSTLMDSTGLGGLRKGNWSGIYELTSLARLLHIFAYPTLYATSRNKCGAIPKRSTKQHFPKFRFSPLRSQIVSRVSFSSFQICSSQPMPPLSGSPRLPGLLSSQSQTSPQYSGQVSMGYLADRFDGHILMFISSFLSSIAVLCVWGFSKTFATLLVFCIAYGSFVGGYSVLYCRFATALTSDDGTQSLRLSVVWSLFWVVYSVDL